MWITGGSREKGIAAQLDQKQKKVPSDFRAASLTAGMHGIEHRIEKRRTI
jgi:hypothetical protein